MQVLSKNNFFSRNEGLISETEQNRLADTSIAIIGTGGDGGLLAERLVRFGIGKIILADPEIFESSNINRQYACNQNTLGKNKAEMVANELRLINPELKIKIYKEGMSDHNVK
ncbi:MAG TPA: ThiF family adenylyltransferase [Chitinophagaceae bacterium]|nr:ThiF family adenylyltransferase [Chitinophagaceae bacterium]